MNTAKTLDSTALPSVTVTAMPTWITETELCQEAFIILKRLEAGESFVIVRDGQAIAKLMPTEHRTFKPMAEIIQASKEFAGMSYQDLRREHDALVDTSVDSKYFND